MREWVYALRIVSTHKSLRFIKTFIIIIIIKMSDVTVADYTTLHRERERERERERQTDRQTERDSTAMTAMHTTHWG